MFRLYKITVIGLRISEWCKEGYHITTAVHSVRKLMGKVWSLHKIFVENAFGKHFYNM